jgi:Zn-dependent protease with chaperone function
MFKFLYMVAIVGLLIWGMSFLNQISWSAQAIDDFMREPKFLLGTLSIMGLPFLFIFYGIAMSISRRKQERNAQRGALLSREKRRARQSMLSN